MSPKFEVIRDKQNRPIELVIRCDLTQPGQLSSSNKSWVVAGTGGFTVVEGTAFKVNLNVIKPK